MRHLYSQKDIRNTRDELLKKQKGICKVTGLPLDPKDAVLDHCHTTQRVRGVIHRQVNAFEGKLSNNYKRLLVWWCPISLPRMLRMLSNYLEATEKEPLDIIHPGWIKKSNTEFNKLNSKGQEDVLKEFFVKGPWKNTEARKKAFDKLLKSKTITFEEVIESIEASAIRNRKKV